MKKVLLPALLLGMISILLFSCKKDKEVTCNLSKADIAPVDMMIVFTAAQTGDGVIKTLIYQAGQTIDTIQDPTLPWTMTLNANEGDNVVISATGTVKTGTIAIAFDGVSGGNEIKATDSCSQDNH